MSGRFKTEDNVWVKTRWGSVLEGKITKVYMSIEGHDIQFEVKHIKPYSKEEEIQKYYYFDLYLRPTEKKSLVQILEDQKEEIEFSLQKLKKKEE